MNLQIAWIFLKLGNSAYVVMIIAIAVESVAFISRLCITKYLAGLSIRKFMKNTVFPCILVAIISSVLPAYFCLNVKESFLRLFLTILISVLSVSVCVMLFGMSKQERLSLVSTVKNRLLKRAA